MRINFDMDGTLANLYGVDNWLSYLENSDAYPYAAAAPMLNLSVLARYLHKAQKLGYEINIVSWLSKGSTAEYDGMVTNAKLEWLAKHLPSVKFDNIIIVPYGTPKEKLSNGILFDDEKRNRDNWGKNSYTEKEIMKILKELT